MAGRRLAEVLVTALLGVALGVWASGFVGADEPSLRDSVLRVDTEVCGRTLQGSLTVMDLGAGPVGVTNAHVSGGAAAVVTGDRSLAVQSTVAGRDAAWVDLSGGPGVTALQPGLLPAVGDPVVVAGYPAGRYREVEGTVVGVEDRVTRGSPGPMLLVDVQAVAGLSGGAVLDAAGEVVGIVVARDPTSGHVVAHPVGELLGRTEAIAAPSC